MRVFVMIIPLLRKTVDEKKKKKKNDIAEF